MTKPGYLSFHISHPRAHLGNTNGMHTYTIYIVDYNNDENVELS